MANVDPADVYILDGSVFVTYDFVGFHRWPDAPDEVKYLASRHRHLFKVRVDVSVEHENRAIEYHMLKRELLGALNLATYLGEAGTVKSTGHANEYEFGDQSCEAIASQILTGLRFAYPSRPYYRVEVSEDGENGSVIEARLER